ncbi:MAG: hypothetical protein Q8P50_00605 [Bacillota bacterium]|nr:hypothetical protein [Bacillota bacterium]
MTSTLLTWVAAFFTLGIFSFVFKDNKAFRISECVLVATTAANGIVLTYHNYIRPTIVVDIGKNGNWHYVLPLLICLMVYTRFFKSLRRWARIPMTFWMGVGAGYIITRQPALLFSQVQASFMSLNTVNNLLFIAGVVSTLVYFYFTVSAKKNVKTGFKFPRITGVKFPTP